MAKQSKQVVVHKGDIGLPSWYLRISILLSFISAAAFGYWSYQSYQNGEDYLWSALFAAGSLLSGILTLAHHVLAGQLADSAGTIGGVVSMLAN